MRARMIALALGGVAACGDSTPESRFDAGPETIDATPIQEPVVLPTTWVVEVPETLTVDAAVTVPGGFVVLGIWEALRFSDDGELTARRRVPEGWGSPRYSGTPDGDVLVAATDVETTSTRVVRFDGKTLEQRWEYVIEGEWLDVVPIGMADGRTLAITQELDGKRRHGVVAIDATGNGTHTLLDVPTGGSSGWYVRSDGTLSGTWNQGTCSRWILDPVSLVSTFSPIDDPDCELVYITVASGLELLSYARHLDPTVQALTVSDAEAAVLAESRTIPLPLTYDGALVADGRIATIDRSGSVRTSRFADLDAQETLEVPFRPGGSAVGAVMASDGDRTFVAWLDQVSTYDTVLRVARVGEIE